MDSTQNDSRRPCGAIMRFPAAPLAPRKPAMPCSR
jgi:hypothetical protein